MFYDILVYVFWNKQSHFQKCAHEAYVSHSNIRKFTLTCIAPVNIQTHTHTLLLSRIQIRSNNAEFLCIFLYRFILCFEYSIWNHMKTSSGTERQALNEVHTNALFNADSCLRVQSQAAVHTNRCTL